MVLNVGIDLSFNNMLDWKVASREVSTLSRVLVILDRVERVVSGSTEVVSELLWKNKPEEDGNTTEYNRVQERIREWELRQLPVGHSHGKLVAEEGLEVSL
jgi:hypothetical protein